MLPGCRGPDVGDVAGEWANREIAQDLVGAALTYARVRMERCCVVDELEALAQLFGVAAAFGKDVAERERAARGTEEVGEEQPN